MTKFINFHIKFIYYPFMKRINKNNNSKIIKQKLKYKPNNSENNKKIRIILEKEQNYYCAYTEYPISDIPIAREIDHFKPRRLLNKNEDNYYNWFVVSTFWNKQKSDKWIDFQPILKLDAQDFEERILYDDDIHTYYYKPNDTEAKNLIELLNLNDFRLSELRKNYIKTLLFKKKNFNLTISELLEIETPIKFRRAVEIVLNIIIK